MGIFLFVVGVLVGIGIAELVRAYLVHRVNQQYDEWRRR